MSISIYNDFRVDICSCLDLREDCLRWKLDTGELELMLALLMDGVESYIMTINRARTTREFEEAAMWIESRDDTYVFSFDNVCKSLGINADYLRKGLKEWEEGLASKQRKPVSWKKNLSSNRIASVN